MHYGFKKFRGGFTLIELLIVVAIIAILAAIAVPNFLEAQVRAKVSRAKADMRTMATGVEAYCVDNNKYPDVNAATLSPPIRLGIVYSRTTLPLISTPIAYLTTGLLPDPFAVGSTSTTFFGYANAKATVDDPVTMGAAGLGSTSAGDRALFVAHRWFFQSVGPDRANFALVSGFLPAFNAMTNKTTLDFFYDPTNGTVSIGDVIRSGAGQL
jgi:prepilin-type N-terminal cleavage/methylation domain-containing protein